MTSIDSVQELAVRRRGSMLAPGDGLPLILVLGLASMALLWSTLAGVSFDRPAALLIALCALALAFSLRRFWRPTPAAEVILYIGLWLLYSAFATELTFLVTRFDFPLRDRWLMAADRGLGFDWASWAGFITAHHVLRSLTDLAYASIVVQPILMIVITFRAPKARNGELLTSLLLGFLASLLVYGLVPNIGPAAMYGTHFQQTDTIRQLREGLPGPYAYDGIVSFPSFHTAMAVLFTLANRDSRWRLAGFGALNLVMLVGVPYRGDHYLIDMVAGAMIGFAAFFAARIIYRRYTGEVSAADFRPAASPESL